jgi:predicted AAA+ superfamily ATPase
MNDIFSGIVDDKIRKILDVLIKNEGELYHLKKISKLSHVPISSSFRLVQKLVNFGIITTIKIDDFKLYKLAENKKTKLLVSLWGK